MECRISILGHIQRGGEPSAFDRIIGTIQGCKAIEYITENINTSFCKLMCVNGIDVSFKNLKDCIHEVIFRIIHRL